MSEPEANAAQIVVSGLGSPWTAPLRPSGVLIGRSDSCDIVLDDHQVSREHARLYQDPYHRWIAEDLESRNGMWIAGRRIDSHAVAPGERITIGPFTLRLRVPSEERIRSDETATTTTVRVAESSEDSAVEALPGFAPSLSQNLLGELDAMGEHLAGVSRSADLYADACKCLAVRSETAVLILCAERGREPRPKEPQILACDFGPDSPSAVSRKPVNFPVSQRVIGHVVESCQAVVASNLRWDTSQLDLTVFDRERPRAVVCAPIAVGDDWADLLYVDMPADQAGQDTAHFVRLVARQIGFVGRSLLQAEDAARGRLLDDQLATAQRLQAGLVPRDLDLSPALDIALVYKPALWVGGDYCDAWRLPDGRVAFALGDVSGKGLPAALAMTGLQAALRTALAFRPDPTEVMSHLGRHLKRHLPAEIFVTMVVGLLDPGTGRLEYVNAGHILPILIRPPASASALGEPRNMPLGIKEETPVSDNAVLEPGAALVLLTDGVTETASPEGELFGLSRVLELFKGRAFETSHDIVHTVVAQVDLFRRHLPRRDDMTVLALRNREVP